jgi:hypothetical protein
MGVCLVLCSEEWMDECLSGWTYSWTAVWPAEWMNEQKYEEADDERGVDGLKGMIKAEWMI